jgi:hypothetical protein
VQQAGLVRRDDDEDVGRAVRLADPHADARREHAHALDDSVLLRGRHAEDGGAGRLLELGEMAGGADGWQRLQEVADLPILVAPALDHDRRLLGLLRGRRGEPLGRRRRGDSGRQSHENEPFRHPVILSRREYGQRAAGAIAA